MKVCGTTSCRPATACRAALAAAERVIDRLESELASCECRSFRADRFEPSGENCPTKRTPIYAVKPIGEALESREPQPPPTRITHLHRVYTVTNLGTLLDVLI